MDITKSVATLKIKTYQLAVSGIENKYDISAEVHEIYQGGSSMASVGFGEIFAKSCANVAARIIVNDTNSLAKVSQVLFANLMLLNPDQMALGVEHFKKQLIKQIPEYCDESNNLKDEIVNEMLSLTISPVSSVSSKPN